jgi:hypothetical protein
MSDSIEIEVIRSDSKRIIFQGLSGVSSDIDSGSGAPRSGFNRASSGSSRDAY